MKVQKGKPYLEHQMQAEEHLGKPPNDLPPRLVPRGQRSRKCLPGRPQSHQQLAVVCTAGSRCGVAQAALPLPLQVNIVGIHEGVISVHVSLVVVIVGQKAK